MSQNKLISLTSTLIYLHIYTCEFWIRIFFLFSRKAKTTGKTKENGIQRKQTSFLHHEDYIALANIKTKAKKNQKKKKIEIEKSCDKITNWKNRTKTKKKTKKFVQLALLPYWAYE